MTKQGLYLVVQFATQKCTGRKTVNKISETANIAELNWYRNINWFKRNYTVAGEEWLNNYLKNLGDTLLNQVEVNPSSRISQFGDGHKVTVISPVKIIAQIGGKTVLLSLKS